MNKKTDILDKFKVVAILPARNEAKRIGKVIHAIQQTRSVDKIIVVDDGSTDSTKRTAAIYGAEVIVNTGENGTGIATKMGLDFVLKFYHPEIILFLDADGQHDPKDIPKFVNKIREGYDFVIGKRDLSQYPIIKKFGNYVLTQLAALLCPTEIKDTECGFKAISSKAAKKLIFKGKRYEICMDFIYNVWKNNFKTSQINIKSSFNKHKGTNVLDGIRNAWFIMNR